MVIPPEMMIQAAANKQSDITRWLKDLLCNMTSPISRVKTITGARGFHSCAPPLFNNLPLPVLSVISVATFKKHLKRHVFDLAFPLDTHTRQPVVAMELFHQFCYWTLISCCVTEPGFAGDTGDIEIWLIDWLIRTLQWSLSLQTGTM